MMIKVLRHWLQDNMMISINKYKIIEYYAKSMVLAKELTKETLAKTSHKPNKYKLIELLPIIQLWDLWKPLKMVIC